MTSKDPCYFTIGLLIAEVRSYLNFKADVLTWKCLHTPNEQQSFLVRTINAKEDVGIPKRGQMEMPQGI